jgi:hypothetical protein
MHTFPILSAGLIHVNVGINHARHDNEVPIVNHANLARCLAFDDTHYPVRVDVDWGEASKQGFV